MQHLTPRLEIYPDRIEHNARAVINQCHAHGINVACVTKVTAAHPAVADAYERAGADMIADSRTANLKQMRALGHRGPFLQLRLPAPSEAFDVVHYADISLNSGLTTLRALSAAAQHLKKTHKVLIMMDVGDLREGVWPDRIVEVVKAAKELPGLEILGLGCNLACYGGVIPSEENMNALVQARADCRRATGLELPILSGGNSSGLPLMAAGRLPKAINHFRVGEAIVLGRNVIDRSPWPGTRQDTFVAVAEVVEVEKKPSMPIGDRGQDAFGGSQEFVDRGLRRRAICNLGRQDVKVDGIEPVDPKMIILGGSSDHLIVDVEEAATDVTVGSTIRFFPGYGGLLALSTSPYVQKLVIREI
jgi:predicted amino acid racemase